MANPWDVPITPIGSGQQVAPAAAPSGQEALLLALKKILTGGDGGGQELPAQPPIQGSMPSDDALRLAQQRQRVNQAFAGGTGNPLPQ